MTIWALALVFAAHAYAFVPPVNEPVEDAHERRRPVLVSRNSDRIIYEVSDGDEFWFEFCRIRRGYFCRTITSSLAETPENHRRLDDHVSRAFHRGLGRMDLVVAAELSVLALIPGAIIGSIAVPRLPRIPASLGATGVIGALALATALPTGAWAYLAHGGRHPDLNERRNLPPGDQWIDLDRLQPNRRGARRTVWLFYTALRLGVNRVSRDLDKHPTWKY